MGCRQQLHHYIFRCCCCWEHKLWLILPELISTVSYISFVNSMEIFLFHFLEFSSFLLDFLYTNSTITLHPLCHLLLTVCVCIRGYVSLPLYFYFYFYLLPMFTFSTRLCLSQKFLFFPLLSFLSWRLLCTRFVRCCTCYIFAWVFFCILCFCLLNCAICIVDKEFYLFLLFFSRGENIHEYLFRLIWCGCCNFKTFLNLFLWCSTKVLLNVTREDVLSMLDERNYSLKLHFWCLSFRLIYEFCY